MSTQQRKSDPSLFPAFQRFIENVPELKNPKGSLFKKIPRILGQGQTRAKHLDAPPCLWERQLELTKLQLPPALTFPDDVQAEIHAAATCVEEVRKTQQSPEGRRRFAARVIQEIPLPDDRKGFRDNQWYAGHFVLTHSADGLSWSWSITPYYEVIGDIPPDHDYILHAHGHAETVVKNSILEPSVFADRLHLAVIIARHLAGGGKDVRLTDVAQTFRVACQKERFWNAPSSSKFEDLPDSAFIANFIASSSSELHKKFEFVPATLSQTQGRNAKVFYLPANPEGTVGRPFVAIRPR